MQNKKTQRISRHKRARAKLKGTAKAPRFCVFRSNKHIYGALIDDEKGKTIIALSDKGIKVKKSSVAKPATAANDKKEATKDSKKQAKEPKPVVLTGKVLVAFELGKLLAEKALEKKITKVIFDRGGFKYHGKVKAVAEGAREAGLKF